jgi:hypothetical protein
MDEKTKQEIDELKDQLEILDSMKKLKLAKCCYCGEPDCEVISCYTGKLSHATCHKKHGASLSEEE